MIAERRLLVAFLLLIALNYLGRHNATDLLLRFARLRAQPPRTALQ